jgi:hypothetical protein
MTQDQHNLAILHLLINTQSEIQALRDLTLGFLSELKNKDKNAIATAYNKKLEEYRTATLAQIKAHYEGFDVDDFLSSVL